MNRSPHVAFVTDANFGTVHRPPQTLSGALMRWTKETVMDAQDLWSCELPVTLENPNPSGVHNG